MNKEIVKDIVSKFFELPEGDMFKNDSGDWVRLDEFGRQQYISPYEDSYHDRGYSVVNLFMLASNENKDSRSVDNYTLKFIESDEGDYHDAPIFVVYEILENDQHVCYIRFNGYRDSWDGDPFSGRGADDFEIVVPKEVVIRQWQVDNERE